MAGLPGSPGLLHSDTFREYRGGYGLCVPAVTEAERVVARWLLKALGCQWLDEYFGGVSGYLPRGARLKPLPADATFVTGSDASHAAEAARQRKASGWPLRGDYGRVNVRLM
jgi:hypothetical protein